MPSLSKLFGKSHGKSDSVSSVSRPQSTQASSTPPPPSYRQDGEPFDPEDVIEPPDLTAGFSNLRIVDEGPLASQEECIAHLKLLECLYKLRQAVSSNDGLFDIYDATVHNLKLNDEDAAPLLAKLAEKRWAIYVARAVDRFRAWQMRFAPSYGKISVTELSDLGMKDQLLDQSYLKLTNAAQIYLTKNNLPPIDVIMVWHTYMLNPRAFLEDCLRRGIMHFWHYPFPLELVANTINSETFIFECNDDVKAAYCGLTLNAWDNTEDAALQKTILCPNCNAATDVVWSEVLGFGTTEGSLSDRVDEMLSGGRGYCDRGFLAHCKVCGIEINHEFLKVGKLCRDIEEARANVPIPLPGLLLGKKGIPGRCMKEIDPSFNKTLSVMTSIFRSEMGLDILALKQKSTSTMLDVKQVAEVHLRNPSFLRHARGDRSSKLAPADQYAFRSIMSRYWDNNTPFALDLVGAVIRQCSFTEKMHNIDWLHSPALFNTIARLRIKYNRFLAIMAMQSGMAVPTLDVDLAWHTNQLNPLRYLKSTVDFVRQFVDHDDKVSEIKLSEAFAQTSQQYQKMYKEPYSECTCWYCEAIRESVATSGERFFNRNKTLARNLDQLHEVDQDPAKSVHISSHNAMRPANDPAYDQAAAKRNEILEFYYAEVCKRARAKGRRVPKRTDYYYSDAYGHPVYMRAYAPFVGFIGYTSILYASAPACMAIGSGGAACAAYAAGAGAGSCACALGAGGCSSMAGSCAAGSCGATASGGMVSGCSGGAGGMSSCGGSSGGGGGCGGGGGGGGGGGCGGGGGGC